MVIEMSISGIACCFTFHLEPLSQGFGEQLFTDERSDETRMFQLYQKAFTGSIHNRHQASVRQQLAIETKHLIYRTTT
jgi:hypothetical protein